MPIDSFFRQTQRVDGSWLGRRLAPLLVLGAVAWSCQPKDNGLEPIDNPTGGLDSGTPGTRVDSGVVPPAPSDWCSSRKVLEGHCSGCHAPGSPFGSIPLITIEHLQAKLPSGLRAYESVGQRIHDQSRLMPPTADKLSPVELATLDNWIALGAPAGSNPTCIPGADDAGTGAGGSSGGGGSSGAGGAAGTGAGGAGGSGGTRDGGVDARVDAPDGADVNDGGAVDGKPGTDSGSDGDGGTQPPTGWPADCEQRYTVLAHGQSRPNDTTKFDVSGATSKDFYQCFLFKAPWGATTVQALRFRPVIDDTRVVARYALYGLDSSNGSDGQITSGPCANGVLVQGWGPGGTETELPADVGLRMPKGSSAYLALEVHYDNSANNSSAMDASGVEFCVTKTLRKNTASVHWLGSTNFSIAAHAQADVSNTCDPTATQPIQLVAIQPQMNRLGVKARLVLNKAGGMTETLHEGRFGIADQKTYSTKAVVNGGDTLVTTCSYNNNSSAAVGFGNAMTDENCYNFVTAYPAGALSSFLLTDRCIGLF